jgi:hypothetical protein
MLIATCLDGPCIHSLFDASLLVGEPSAARLYIDKVERIDPSPTCQPRED